MNILDALNELLGADTEYDEASAELQDAKHARGGFATNPLPHMHPAVCHIRVAGERRRLAMLGATAAILGSTPPKLLGWRADNFLMETADHATAVNWDAHHKMMPIFEGDPYTKLPVPDSQPRQSLTAPSKMECIRCLGTGWYSNSIPKAVMACENCDGKGWL